MESAFRFALVALQLCWVHAYAQTLIESAEVRRYGIYDAVSVQTINDPTSPTGVTVLSNRQRHIETTNEIPALLGIRFGLECVVLGSPNNGHVLVRTVWRYPPGGIRNPKTGQVVQQTEEMSQWVIGRPNYRGYHFDWDWEMVPGTWVFEMWHGGRKLLEHRFTVITY